MANLNQLRSALGAAVDELGNLTANPKAFAKVEAEIADLEAEIKNLERVQTHQRKLARPAAGGESHEEINPEQRTLTQIRAMGPTGQMKGFDDYLGLARKGLDFKPSASQHYRSLGEQLQSIFRHYASKGSDTDPRLVRAPTGASDVDPTGGGFLVQVDFASAIFMLAHDMGRILQDVRTLPISANSNGVKIPGVDETSRATGSRWGGVSSYWVGEGTTVTPTKPKFRMIEFDLKKLMSTMYASDEVLQDSSLLAAIASQAFSEEIMFMTEDSIFEGTGAGMPLGVLNSSALITVNKQASQTATTLVKENIDNMYARMWARSIPNAKWYINQDIIPQLQSLSQAISTAGGQAVYQPPGGISAAPYSTLYGKEIVWTEYNSTLGQVGDILFADFSQYTLVDKNGIQAATSMHVAFLTDEQVFRITYRVDGKPMWTQPLTPFKGSNTKSPFVALQAR